MNIRKCEKTDLQACASLLVEVYSEPPYNERWSLSNAEAYLERFWNIEPERCLVAENNGRIEGVLFGFSYPWQKRINFYIQEIFVRKGARRQDIGYSLIRHATKDLGLDVSISLVANEATEAAAFYQKLGLSQHRHYKFYTGIR